MNGYRALLIWGPADNRHGVVLPWQGDIFDAGGAGEEELQSVVNQALEHPRNLALQCGTVLTVPFEDVAACVCVIPERGEPDVIAAYRLVRQPGGYRLEMQFQTAQLGISSKWLLTYGISPQQIIGLEPPYQHSQVAGK